MATERNHSDPITFEIKEHLCLIAKKNDGWTRELNIVSWNGQEPPKFDIRDWNPSHTKMTKGITLFDYEMRKVSKAYMDYCNARTVSEGMNSRNAAAEAGLRAGQEAARAQEETDEFVDNVVPTGIVQSRQVQTEEDKPKEDETKAEELKEESALAAKAAEGSLAGEAAANF